MKLINDFSNMKVLVLGYGQTGHSVAEYLVDKGASVLVNDSSDPVNDSSIDELKAKGVEFIFGEHPLELLAYGFDLVVKSPGIPYHIPFVEKLIERKIPIVTDIELVGQETSSNIIGVTGSNGKTTTTTLIYEILKEGTTTDTYLAGNIGIPALEQAIKAKEGDNLVMELSSFQLEGTVKFKPNIAVITNLYEAHLDYHKTRTAYVNAKLKLLKNLTEDDYFVYNYDQEELREVGKGQVSRLVPFSIKNVDDFVISNGAYLLDDYLYFRGEKVIAVEDIMVVGEHNLENILAAIAASSISGVAFSKQEEVIKNFKGIKHRLQYVGEVNGRSFYNDAKSTNPTATITALKSFDKKVIYIGGGLDRNITFEELVPYLNRIKRAELYGESKEKMARIFEENNISYKLHDNLKQATLNAYKNSEEDDIILLSPANASWDQFKDFNQRGDYFIDCINSLKEQED